MKTETFINELFKYLYFEGNKDNEVTQLKNLQIVEDIKDALYTFYNEDKNFSDNYKTINLKVAFILYNSYLGEFLDFHYQTGELNGTSHCWIEAIDKENKTCIIDFAAIKFNKNDLENFDLTKDELFNYLSKHSSFVIPQNSLSSLNYDGNGVILPLELCINGLSDFYF